MKHSASKKLLWAALVAILSLSLSVQASAQKKNVTLKADGITVANLIKEVEKQTDYLFVYNQEDVNPAQTVSVSATNEPAIDVLAKVFAGTGIEAKLQGSNIVLKKVQPAAKNGTVKGKVVDENGEPAVGVSVIQKGTMNGVSTDINGDFAILAPADATLEVSSIGFKTVEVPVAGKNNLSIILASDTELLEDVVVIGYGTAKKRDYIGSASVLKGEDVAKVSPVSVESALQGMASGVQVNGNNGVPGAPQQVKIRGISSISSGTDPLWIIDGMPVQSSAMDKTFDGETQQSVLGMFNPNDIESIQVLKDAAATAIYGSRGSNGVIIVTTKSGKKGGVKVNLDVKGGVSNWERTDIGLANSSEWFQIADMAMMNTYKTHYDVATTYQNLDNMTEKPTLEQAKKINTNWADAISRTGSFYEANASLSSGSEKTSTYASFKYRKDNGNLKFNDMETFAGNVKLNWNICKWVDLSYRIAATYTKNNRIKSSDGKAGSGGWGQVNANALPWYDVYSATGYNGYWNSMATINPLASMDDVNSKSALETMNLLSVLGLTINLPVDGLKIKAEWGANYINSNAQSWQSQYIRSDGAIAKEQKNTMLINNLDAYISYDKKFNENHELNAVAGIESNRRYAHLTDLTGLGLVGVYPEIGTPTNLSGSSQLNPSSERYLVGYFVRANYKLMDRYIINASARRDGLSSFTADNRWANFFSGGLGWLISEEPWFNKEAMNLLKLRGSVGQTGNINTPSGVTSDYWKIASGASRSLVGNNSSYLYSIGNSDIKWETTTSYDVGIDYGFLNNRINGSLAYYRQNVKDMLLKVSLPYSAGIRGDKGEGQDNFCWGNVGNMYNQGVEFDINATIIQRKNFTWTAGFNISYNMNRITALDSFSDQTGAGMLNTGDAGQVRTIMKTGHAYGTYYMAEYAGVDPQKGIPMIYEVKTDGNGETTHTGNIIPATTTNMEANRMILDGKSALPKFVGGLNTSFNFYGFDIYALFAFQTGNYIYSRLRQSAMTPNAGMMVMDKRLLTDSWQKAGDVTDIPQVNAACVYYYDDKGEPTTTATQYGSENKTPSSRFLEKGDFLKLRNLTIGYTIPFKNVKENGIKGLRVYVVGTNLFTCTQFSGYDPEIPIDQSTGGAVETFTAMPSTRAYTLGVNLNF